MKQTSEFGSRMEAQRAIIKTINQHSWPKEPLVSLTQKSIERWVNKNRLSLGDPLTRLLFKASEKLFFLANKSQEQITDDYQKLSKEVGSIHKEITGEVEKLFSF